MTSPAAVQSFIAAWEQNAHKQLSMSYLLNTFADTSSRCVTITDGHAL